VIVAIFAGSQRLTNASRIVSAPAKAQVRSITAKILNTEDIATRYQLPTENSSSRQNSFLVAEVRHLAAQAVWLRWRPPSLHLQCGILRVRKITVALVRKSEGR
jgi:hypothetical protein